MFSESDAQSDYSLFEALRDSIYAEVATLISQNESRPHFLVSSFHIETIIHQQSVHGGKDLKKT